MKNKDLKPDSLLPRVFLIFLCMAAVSSVHAKKELPKSFIIAEKNKETKIYISNLTVQTIMKRNNV